VDWPRLRIVFCGIFFAIRYFYDNYMTIGGSCYGVCSEIPCLLGLSAPFC
jgi:hypothetical protein